MTAPKDGKVPELEGLVVPDDISKLKFFEKNKKRQPFKVEKDLFIVELTDGRRFAIPGEILLCSISFYLGGCV